MGSAVLYNCPGSFDACSFHQTSTAMTRMHKISWWLKIPYTLYVCVLVPVYWINLGPQNFLWGCDIALLATLVAIWLENRFIASTMAVAIIIPELIWNLGFFSRLVTGHDVIGLALTEYMFSNDIPRLVRGLSLFHVFLVWVLIWLLHRLGYDRRALWAQTLITWIVLPVSYGFTDPSRNINFVFGFEGTRDIFSSGPLWVALLMMTMPLLVYLPTHLVLKRIFSPHR